MSDQTSFTESVGFQESYDPALRRAFENASQEVDPELVDYSKVKIRKDSLLVSGDYTFYTLQGEGPTTGMPCVFIRLHNCNLRCTWCDAFYTWDPRSTEFWTESRPLGFRDAADAIEGAWEGPTHIQKRIIWTGGEPLIQRKQIDEVMHKLDSAGYYGDSNIESELLEWAMEIETNGTLMPTREQLLHAQFNCSPKLSNSENKEYSMVKPKILDALDQVNTTFKFVCMTESDLDEIEEKYLPYISHNKVIIMPQGITEEEVSVNAKRLAEPCKQRGYRLMARLQNICWDGARRGV